MRRIGGAGCAASKEPENFQDRDFYDAYDQLHKAGSDGRQ